MFIRSIFFIVLLVYLFPSIVIAQSTDDSNTSSEPQTSDESTTTTPILTTTTTTPIPTTTTTPHTACNYPDEFPLFNDDTCISRTWYTIIFLASIILGGLSFLMIIAILILICCRSSRKSGRVYSAGRSTKPFPAEPKLEMSGDSSTLGEYRVYAEPMDNDTNRPLSAPYTSARPVTSVTTRTENTKVVKTANGNARKPDAYEMKTRARAETSTKPPRFNPPATHKVTDLDDIRDSRSSYRNSISSQPESSYF